jgi:hypothetical protein
VLYCTVLTELFYYARYKFLLELNIKAIIFRNLTPLVLVDVVSTLEGTYFSIYSLSLVTLIHGITFCKNVMS